MKYFRILPSLALFVILYILSGCVRQGGEPVYPDVVDTSPTIEIDTTRHIHSQIVPHNPHTQSNPPEHYHQDTIQPIGPRYDFIPNDSPKQALLGYSYFKKIKRNESKNINVFISVSHSEGSLRDSLKIINMPETNFSDHDTPTVSIQNFPENFSTFDSIDVTLVDPQNAFSINNLAPKRQSVDELSRWEWTVVPTTDMQKATLVINAVPYRRDGSVKFIDPQTIIIEIEIVPGFFRKLWIFINDNPWTIITVIFIPLIVFFGKRWLSYKKLT